ncbi:MAG: radical SAM protein [Clostridia bacterium]|nr:radical SAM protein [Clostridia bacterium]
MERVSLSKNTIDRLSACKVCPKECGVNRLNATGACGVQGLKIAKYYLHPFEEPCVSFRRGSGTIFFTGCNLRCVFCQNYDLSRNLRGKEISVLELVDIFKELEDRGAENISLVTPTHYLPYLCEALSTYKPSVPVVYNTSGYEKIDSLKEIDPFIDIYLPDLKFFSPALSARYTGIANYFDVASEAVTFMAQKPLSMTDEGKMLSGCIVRHLVVPMGVSDSKAILKWFKNHLPEQTYLSLMSQYTPFGKIENLPELSRAVTAREYDTVVQTAFDLGLRRLFVQERSSSSKAFIPDWDY